MNGWHYNVSLTAEEVDTLYKALDLLKKNDKDSTEKANSVIIKLEGTHAERDGD